MSNDQTPPPATESPVHYTWVGHLLDEDEPETQTVQHGGDTTAIHAIFTERPDGALAIDLTTTGPSNRRHLSRLVNLLQSIVTQDAMSFYQEQEERRKAREAEEPEVSE